MLNLRSCAALLLVFPWLAYSAMVTHKFDSTDPEDSLRIQLVGDITGDDVHRIENVLNRFPRRNVMVRITSSGGDTDGAMEIGRLLRSRNASIEVLEHCYSSCVFVYVGAVERMNPARPSVGFFESRRAAVLTGLGIHRFYFVELSTKASIEQISVARNTQKAKIERYLRDMNVSTQLLDAMEAVAPERMKVLTLREANALGVSDTDAVYEEQQVALQASRYSITSSEYRRRAEAAKTYCIDQDRKKVCAKSDLDCQFGFIYECRMRFIQTGGK